VQEHHFSSNLGICTYTLKYETNISSTKKLKGHLKITRVCKCDKKYSQVHSLERKRCRMTKSLKKKKKKKKSH